MYYVVRMADIPKGPNPIVEIQDDAVIIGPWQNTGADHVSFIYLVPVGIPPEDENDNEKETTKEDEVKSK